MKKRKILGILAASVVVVALAGALVACSSTSTSSTASSSGSQSTQQVTNTPVTLEVFAANSLQKAMPAIMAAYQQNHSWVTFSDAQYLSSGDLVTKLQSGASADILITASKSTMDQAQTANLIDVSSRFNMFTNDLVVVAKAGSGITINSLSDVLNYTICLGDESVPAGNYAPSR